MMAIRLVGFALLPQASGVPEAGDISAAVHVGSKVGVWNGQVLLQP